MGYTFNNEIKAEIEARFLKAKIRIDKVEVCKSVAAKIVKNRARYEKVASVIGCPWYFVGIIHSMECGLDFNKWLANGDPLSGPTVRVPAGLTCDGTWEDGAIVSLRHDGVDKQKDWSLARMLFILEGYNGFGYRNRGKPSQYVWSFTNVEEAGRYVADNVWDENVWSNQVGCVAALLSLAELGAIAFQQGTGRDGAVELQVTWCEAFRLLASNGTVETGICGWAGAEPKLTWRGTAMREMINFCLRFSNAGTFLVAAHDKQWPGELPTKPTEPPKPAEPAYLKITRTGRSNSKGLEVLQLEVVNGAGEKWLCHSGAPGRQVFERGGSHNIPGSLYPCPQGEYSVEDIQWAAGKDNYNASHGPGLGPVFVPFNPEFETRRGAFGFHVDENVSTSPGSAGCIVFDNTDELKRFVAVLRKYDPKRLVVAWGV